MTGYLDVAELLSGKTSVPAGLRACGTPVWMRDCISGKKTMEAAQIELGSKAWAPSVVAGAQQIALREQCPGSLVEVTGDERR